MTAEFFDAGHLLGSAMIRLTLRENGVEKSIVFSGDIGNVAHPIIRDPTYLKSADYVVMETTYGDREHEPEHAYTEELAKIIDETLGRGGNVVIPAFAVGRTQELLYYIREIKEKKMVRSVPDFPVYVDSPLAGRPLIFSAATCKATRMTKPPPWCSKASTFWHLTGCG